MAIYVGSARIDENGNASGGKPGDNKQISDTNDVKGEVSMQTMYNSSKGWYVLRPKKITYANKIAERMKKACNNKHIGYDQSNRLGVIKYGIDTTINTECDCSSLVRECIKEATNKDVGNFTTYNEKNVLYESGLFEKPFEYISQKSTPIYNGDILVTKTKGHTVIVVSGNPRKKSEAADFYPKCETYITSIIDGLKSVGENDVSLNHRKQIAIINNLSSYSGKASENNIMLNLLKDGKLKKG